MGISYGEPNDSKDINVTVAISFPSGNNPIHEKCFKMPEGEKIRITWTISELKKPNVAQYWKAIDHYSTLPYIAGFQTMVLTSSKTLYSG